jgi:outer membrane protein assembly factor BamA
MANFSEIGEGIERIKKRVRRQGFMRTEIAVTRIPDDAKKSVDLIVQVTQGPRFVFGELKLEGLDIHGEAAVKKLWSLKPEQPFNADYPDFFLNRIREDNLFDGLGKTKAKVDIEEGSLRVDVTLLFGAASIESDGARPGRPGRRRL